MSNLDTIKQYLVSIGFSVDNSAYHKAEDTLNKLDNVVQKTTGSESGAFLKAGGIIVGVLASITSATVTLMDKLAQADLGYQKYGLHMYMATDRAKQMKIATDALGESLNDIAWMPELRERYFSLMSQEKGMGLPGEYEGQMRTIRDIRFEFTRLKVEMTYGLQWIGYSLFKYLDTPIFNIKDKFKSLNDWLTAKMPIWTEKVAHGLSMFVQLGGDVVRVGKDIFTGLEAIWDSLPKGGKAIAVLAGIVTTYFMMGPIGRMAMILSGIVLAVDEFYAFIDGRKSSKILAPIWGILIMAVDTISRGMMTAIALGTRFWDVVSGNNKIPGSLKEDLSAIWNTDDPNHIAGTTSTLDKAGYGGANPLTNYKEFMDAWHKNNPETKSSEPSSIQGLKDSIEKQESGGNYGAVGPEIKGRGSALGKYQIMPENWPEWAKAAGLSGKDLTLEGMTPENQEKVTASRLTYLMKKYNNNSQLTEAAWAGGERAADRLKSGDMSVLNIKMGGGLDTTIGDYIKKVSGQTFQPINQTTNTVQIDLRGTVINSGKDESIAHATKMLAQKINNALGIKNARMINELSGVVQ